MLSFVERYTLDVMHTGRQNVEIDRFVTHLINDTVRLVSIDTQSNSITNDLHSTSLSSLSDNVLHVHSSLTTRMFDQSRHERNTNVRVTFNNQNNFQLTAKICSLYGSYFINRSCPIANNVDASLLTLRTTNDPMIDTYLNDHQIKSINEFSLHRTFDDSRPSPYYGIVNRLTIDSNGVGHLFVDRNKTNMNNIQYDSIRQYNAIKLYTDKHREYLDARIQSYSDDDEWILTDFLAAQTMTTIRLPCEYVRQAIDNVAQFSMNTMKFAPIDRACEIRSMSNDRCQPYSETNDQDELLDFIRDQLCHYTWPIDEYIGIHGQRAWRALKLAADISNFAQDFIINYHRDIDWLSSSCQLGSFSQRTHRVRQQ
jgi:hypothetical protein